MQPGKYLVLIGGEVADVEESLAAGREVGGAAAVDFVYLPQVHPEVVEAIGGGRVPEITDALGVVETTTVAAAIHAADAGVKGARCGWSRCGWPTGWAARASCSSPGWSPMWKRRSRSAWVLERPGLLVRQVVIPQLHPDVGECRRCHALPGAGDWAVAGLMDRSVKVGRILTMRVAG